MKNLQNIIAMDGFTQEGIDMAKKVGINPITLEYVEEVGKGYMDSWKEKEATRDDYLMICYTSGTSGMPKGVKITQKMLTQVAASINCHIEANGEKGPGLEDTYMSYLPAAHVFEQAIFSLTCFYGIRCGVFSGDPTKLIKTDIPALKPTFFPAVPRVLNAIYGIMQSRIKE